MLAILERRLFCCSCSRGRGARERRPNPRQLNKLTPEQRQATLVEKAKAEGEVNFYSTLQAQQIEPFLQVFRKRYPFVKVVPYRVSGNRQLIKIQTEFNAGNHTFDVANGSPELGAALRKIGAIDPYHSPQRDFFTVPNKDKEGYFTSFYVMPIVLGTTRISSSAGRRRRATRSWFSHDAKAIFFSMTRPYEWFAVMLKHLGRDRGLQFMRNLAKQDLRMVRGRTAQSQLLAAGERAVAINVSGPTTLDLKARGAPVDQVIVDPTTSRRRTNSCARAHALISMLLLWFHGLVVIGRRPIDRHYLWPSHRAQRRQTTLP